VHRALLDKAKAASLSAQLQNIEKDMLLMFVAEDKEAGYDITMILL